MKKKLVLFLCMLFCSGSLVFAKPIKTPPPSKSHYHSSSSSYLVRTDSYSQEHKFPDCDEHKMTSETVVSFYSDGRSSTYTRYTLMNKDGTVIEDNCSDASHVVYKKKHYFIFKKNRKYNLMRTDGELISSRKYTYMREIAPNRLLVRANKKYGVIDLNENTVSPLKYKEIDEVGKNLFITKLNGYYGMMDSSNNILVKNEYNNIKPLYDTFILKKCWDYGLADKYGKVILEPVYDRIKTLGEYILVKQGKDYKIYDATGKLLSDKSYKKVRLKRNVLQGKQIDEEWKEIETSL